MARLPGNQSPSIVWGPMDEYHLTRSELWELSDGSVEGARVAGLGSREFGIFLFAKGVQLTNKLTAKRKRLRKVRNVVREHGRHVGRCWTWRLA